MRIHASKFSLFLRLLFVSALGLVLAMTAIGMATQRGFVGVAEEAQIDRLESVVLLLLASMDIDAEGQPQMPDGLAEGRLGQPGSGLYAGLITASGSWVSQSVMDPEVIPEWQGVQAEAYPHRQIASLPKVSLYQSYFLWERLDGERVVFQAWAAEDYDRLDSQVATFNSTLWRWMSISLLVVVAVQSLLMIVFMQPFRKLVKEIGEIERGHRTDLSDRYPQELQLVSRNLNRLLDWERERGRKYRNATANLAHALKTPISAIQARLQSGRSLDREELVADIKQIDTLLARQLERVSIAARAISQPMVLLLPTVERVCKSIQQLQASQRGALSISIDIEPGLAVRVDDRDLTEILGNLIENAAKYGRERILIEASAIHDIMHGQGVRVVVHDDGIGIESTQFEHLLQRGVRGDQLTDRQGQGLGLAIVADLMDSYSGDIQLVSGVLGGAAVEIRFWHHPRPML